MYGVSAPGNGCREPVAAASLARGGRREQCPGSPFTRRPPHTNWPGFLVSTDAYMNLQLANTEEYIDGQFTGNLGEVLIR